MVGLQNTLSTAEAVDLAHALVAFVASDLEIRAVFIKGPSLAHHGLRAARVSTDADLLVERSRRKDLVEGLAARGWGERDLPFTSAFTDHSITLIREDWPCDIDVHDRYPGFLADPDVVFDEIWRSRQSMVIAGTKVPIAGHAASAIILALHALRGSVENSRQTRELLALETEISLEFDKLQRRAIVDLARNTGAVATLGEVLVRIGGQAEPSAWERSNPALVDWQRREAANAAGVSGAYLWVREIQRRPWKQKLAVVRAAIWPRSSDLLMVQPTLSKGDLVRVRVARLGRGLKRLPSVLCSSIRAGRRP